MVIEFVKLSDLSASPNNARKHSSAQIKQLAESIRTFGFTNPILISDSGEIVAGHGRAAAAARVGMDLVPCIRLTLSDVMRRAYNVADNRLAELGGGWDLDALQAELKALSGIMDISITGFDLSALATLTPEPMKAPPPPKESAPPPKEVAPDPVTKGKVQKTCPHCGGSV